MQYRRRWKDGSYRWIEARAQPLRDRDGTIVHWYQVSIDIDDQVRAQAALREGERRYRDVFHYMPIGLTQLDASKLIPLFKELQARSEEHTSELQSLMRISYAVFCLKKKKQQN